MWVWVWWREVCRCVGIVEGGMCGCGYSGGKCVGVGMVEGGVCVGVGIVEGGV